MNAPSKITSGAIVRAPKAPSHCVWALRARACVCCVCPHQRNGDRDHLKLARWACRLSPSGVRMRSSVAICRRVWAHRSPCPPPCLPLCSLAQIAFSRVSEPNIGFCFFLLYNNCLIVYITHEDRYRWSAYTHLVVSASNPQSHHIVVCFVKMCMCVGVPVCVCVLNSARLHSVTKKRWHDWCKCSWMNELHVIISDDDESAIDQGLTSPCILHMEPSRSTELRKSARDQQTQRMNERRRVFASRICQRTIVQCRDFESAQRRFARTISKPMADHN